MKKHSPVRILSAALLILGLLCTCSLIGVRDHTEQSDRACAAAFTEEGLALLAERSGLSAEIWQKTLAEAGVSYWIREGIVYTASGASAAVLPGKAYDPSLPAALIENHTRTGVFAPEGMDPAVYTGPVVKALWLFDDYADRADVQGAQEIEDLLFRAVTDRGQRLLLLQPFVADGAVVTDPAVYAQCLSGLSGRLFDRGILFGKTFSVTPILDAPLFLTVLAGFVPVFAAVWLLSRLLPLKKLGPAVLFAGLAAEIALFLAVPALAQKLVLLGAAIVYPCCAARKLADWIRNPPDWLQKRSFVLSALLTAGCVLGAAIAAGLSVAALMTSRPYLLCTTIFSGVKAALLLPLAFAFVLLLVTLLPDLRQGGKKSLVWLAVIFAGAALVWLLLTLRSGDAGISGLENAFRAFLERTLYARPRTKELLFGAPCIALFVLAVRRRFVPGALACGLGVTLETVSVVNTFCHAVAPVRLSITRSLLGGVLGLALGLIICGILSIKKPKS